MHFIERILEVSQSGVQLQILGMPIDITKNKTITDTIQNINLCKQLYMSVYNTIGDNLPEYIINFPILNHEKIDEDMRINAFYFITNQNKYNSNEIINTCDYFFYFFDRFPGNLELATVPQADILKFIETKDFIFPAVLYQKFNNGHSQGLVCTQFMAAFNIFRWGSKTF